MCALPFYQTGFNRETLLILIEQSNAQKPRYEVRIMEDVEMVRAIDSQLVIDFGFKIATNG